MKYTQCRLKKKTSDGTLEQMSFIPDKFAVMGKVLKLKEGQIWDDGWVVESVGKTISEEYLPNPHIDIKRHRKNTGDSLPKELTKKSK